MSYQKVIIVGNLGRDPEMRYMPDGTAVTCFSVATSIDVGRIGITLRVKRPSGSGCQSGGVKQR